MANTTNMNMYTLTGNNNVIFNENNWNATVTSRGSNTSLTYEMLRESYERMCDPTVVRTTSATDHTSNWSVSFPPYDPSIRCEFPKEKKTFNQFLQEKIGAKQ